MQIKKKETMGNAGWQSRGKESKGDRQKLKKWLQRVQD